MAEVGKPDLGGVLEELGAFLERSGIAFALSGGMALQALGRSRSTFDVDLIVPDSARRQPSRSISR